MAVKVFDCSKEGGVKVYVKKSFRALKRLLCPFNVKEIVFCLIQIMAGFDDLGVFFSDNLLTDEEAPSGSQTGLNVNVVKKRFKEFLGDYHDGDFEYKYRNQVKDHYNVGQYWIEVSVDDLASFDADLADKLVKFPIEYLHVFELATTEFADYVTRPRNDGLEDQPQHMQVSLYAFLSIIFMKRHFFYLLNEY